MERERIIQTLEWLVADAKWRRDQVEHDLNGGYSPELQEAINVLTELKGQDNGSN